jgi:hypothetical protein
MYVTVVSASQDFTAALVGESISSMFGGISSDVNPHGCVEK